MLRLKVVCLLKVDDRFLFAIRTNSKSQRQFFVPPGGRIELFEYSWVAVEREMREEVGVELRNPKLLGVLENMFEWREQKWHEVIFVYLDDRVAPIEIPAMGIETNGEAFPLVWKSMSELIQADLPIFPDGLLDLLVEKRVC